MNKQAKMAPKERTGRVFALGILTVAFLGTTAVPAADIPQQGNLHVIKCPYIPPEIKDDIPTCQGMRATCVGTDGHDLIWGTEDDDVIVALGGDDVVHADAGEDLVCGGPGNDSIHGARGPDTIYGQEGTDWLFGARENDSLFGGPGDGDVLWGGPGMDLLDGGEGLGDFCIQQRDMARVNEDTCEVVYPPPGYTHSKEYEIPPGIVEEAIIRR